ncbi:hypothetical protein S83_042162 [Arachis hypogaea]
MDTFSFIVCSSLIMDYAWWMIFISWLSCFLIVEEAQQVTSDDAPEKNPQYTTVYVSNLALEVTSVGLHHHFHALGVGIIEDVRVQHDKGFGFMRNKRWLA